MSKGNVALGLGIMAGLAIGGLSGILFAPGKGSQTRKNIMDKGDDYLHRLNFEKTKKEAKREAEKAKVKYDKAKKDAKNAVSDFKHSVS